MKYDFVVVGAGLCGATMAERLASQLGKTVLVIEKRPYVGGNVYDEYDKSGILIGKYGPHTFHTDDKKVFDYIMQFTEWNKYEHRVVSYVDGKFVPFPICINTINELYDLDLSAEEFERFIDEQKVPIAEVLTSEDVVLSQAGYDIYEKFFKNFTYKQWGVNASELDSSVIKRIPFRTNKDTRYFTDKYQGNPVGGYTAMIKNMLNNQLITVVVGKDYKEIIKDVEFGEMIYTGPLDYYFDYKYGHLKYRSVNMVFETYEKEAYSDYASMRFPNDYEYTRVTEFKKMTGQKSKKTTILKEYPCDEGEPFYPFPVKKWNELAEKYKAEARDEKGVLFIGRLAEYKYYDMDDVIRASLDAFEAIKYKYENTSFK